MGETDITFFEDLIREKDWSALRHELEDMDPILIAEIIDELPEQDDVILFRLLPRGRLKHLSIPGTRNAGANHRRAGQKCQPGSRPAQRPGSR